MALLKERLKNGEQVLGTMVTAFASPDMAKILQSCGFDFFIVDCEHGAFTTREAANIIAVARGIGMPALVRIPEMRREHALKFMEMGASGLLLPNTETAEQARMLVDCTKYAPMGHRGVSLSRPHTDFKRVDGREYMRRANEETILMCQIESRKPSGYDVPTYTTEQWRAMHEGVNNHIVERNKAPKQSAKAEDKKEGSNMQKSKLDSLIARARKNPAVLNQQTLTMLNNHLAKTGQPLVTVPAPTRPWGSMPNVSDIAASREVAATNTAAIPVPKAGVFAQSVMSAAAGGRSVASLTGHQRAALSVGCDPSLIGLERMSLQDMKDAAKQQQMTTVNALRQKQGLPPL